MAVLRNVDLTEYYHLCAVYALTRSCANLSLAHLLTGEGKEFVSWDLLCEGDIVCWDVHEIEHHDYPIAIRGKLLYSPRIYIDRHFGVVENDSMVSDLTFTTDYLSNQYPIIRMREIKELKIPNRWFSPAR